MAGSTAPVEAAPVRMLQLATRAGLPSDVARSAAAEYVVATHNYSLEGDALHWMGCAMYMAYKAKNNLPERHGNENKNIFTSLLKLCKISPVDFFHKIKRWIEMTQLPEEFKIMIEQLESKFSVSKLLFQKYKTIFAMLFNTSDIDEIIKTKSKNSKTTICTQSNLFEFTWCLFICVKGERPNYSNDIVFTYHILLSCMDMVYANVYMALRKDLINPKFEGLPSNWSSMKLKPTSISCIMEYLCKNNIDQVVEAKSNKQYPWRESVLNFFNKGFLKGDNEKFTGLLDAGNYEFNIKSLIEMYSKYTLTVGEFDERIFLDDSVESLKNIPDEVIQPTSSHKVSDTPLSGRQYLKNKNEQLTPGTVANQNESKLHIYLSGCTNTPSRFLQGLYPVISVFDNNLRAQKNMAAKLLAMYASRCSEDLAADRINLVEAFFYRLFEDVIKEELKKKGQIDLQCLLSHEIFHQTLFACSAEIVLYTYGSPNVPFPWILDVLDLHPFYFYKIIELVVLSIKEKLSRDIIKHLNMIEEQVLQLLAWKSNSPLWEKIAGLGETIPHSSDVCIPNSVNGNNKSVIGVELQTVRVLQTISRMPQSPVSSPSDRFLSPTNDIRTQNFNEIRPGQSLLQLNVNPSNDAGAAPPRKAPVKGGSLGLFFRKFYGLAAIRMDDLCSRLRIHTDNELMQKIWTCFEHSIINLSHLMKDRHLDQILMCAVYVICKVSISEQNKVEFTDIMKCYRQQPQSCSDVYRRVLGCPNTPPPVQNNGNEAERTSTAKHIDLIEFYNTVYVPSIQQFVNSFIRNQPHESYELSPLPMPHSNNLNRNNLGGRRISEHHNLFIRPLTDNTAITNEQSQLTYCFSRSPAKDLHEINSLISKEVYFGKRRQLQLADEEITCNKVLRLDGTDDDDTEK